MNINGIDSASLGQRLKKNTGQVVSITSGASAQSAVVHSLTKTVVLCATVNCWLEIGSDPTATLGSGTSTYLPAGALSYPIEVTGGTTKIAAISDSASGKLSIFEAL